MKPRKNIGFSFSTKVLPKITPGLYKHHNTNQVYELVNIARHGQTTEPYVVYKELGKQPNLYVEPYNEFFKDVHVFDALDSYRGTKWTTKFELVEAAENADIDTREQRVYFVKT